MSQHVKHAIQQAIGRLPATLREEVRSWCERLEARYPGDGLSAFPGEPGLLIRLVASSPYAAGVLLRDWASFAGAAAADIGPPDAAGLAERFDRLLESASSRASFMAGLRRLRNRSLVAILWRDIADGPATSVTLKALSDLAEAALDAAVKYATRQSSERFGVALKDGEALPLIVLAMGKLGGRELNFSSDIDIIFLYPADCETSGPRQISAHEYFGKIAREAVTLLEQTTEDGFVYRVDTRLRPFGNSGPPVVSFAALESYLVDHGRGWERYAYVKARPVTATAASEHARRLMSDIVGPFVFRRYLDYGIFESLRDMQARIAAEVRKRELANDVKLGPGGIREIEFIVQSLQIVRGGNTPALQTTGLRAAMFAAVGDKDMSRETADRLIEAYDLLRRVENAIQAARDQQKHALPSSAEDRDRLAVALDYPDWPALDDAIVTTRRWVSDQFRSIGMRDAAARKADPEREVLETLWSSRAPAADWLPGIEALGIAEADEIAEIVARLADAPEVRRIDAVAARRLRRFIANLLLALRRCDSPVIALSRTIEVAESVFRRSAYLALLNENPQVLERLVDLCARSIYLTAELVRYPVLLDELIDARIIEEPPAPGDITREFRVWLEQTEENDAEARIESIAEFKRATLFRLAVADFGGSIPLMKVSDRLTELAEQIIGECLALAYVDVTRQFGEPTFEEAGTVHIAGLGVIAYGKLAGFELSYGSDLDLVFVHDSRGEKQQTNGARPVDNQVFFSRLVRRLVHFLTAPTAAGSLYEIDTRLRPSGRSGLLVTSIDAFARYQEENAWTWEHQALLRSRPVAGSQSVAEAFSRIRSGILRDAVRRDTLREDVLDMRHKMRAQLDKSDAQRFDLKQGAGGVADIEFLVQYLVLLQAADHPAVIDYPDNIRQLDALAEAGCRDPATIGRLQDIYRGYRQRMHRLALDRQPAVVAADEFLDARRFVTDVWRRTFDVA
jgi:glutamate-ammonia-ligase adenylyltransferase